jgi:hypothetical protein
MELMKKIATSIFVPSKTKNEMPLGEMLNMTSRLNISRLPLSNDLGLGTLDDVKEGEEFELVVNGECEKHHILLKGINKVGGKLRLMVQNTHSPEVQRFLEWRLDRNKLMSSNKGKVLQLKNFTTDDLRRLIRHAFANQERTLVNYR